MNKEDNTGKKNLKGKITVIIILTVIAILIILFAVYDAKMRKEAGNNVYYNGYHFMKVGILWSTMVPNPYYPVWYFHFNPKQVEDIPTEGNMSEEFRKARLIYVTFNPRENNLSYVALVTGDLSLDLSKYFNQITRPACTLNTSDCENVTILTCDEAERDNITTIFLTQGGPAYIKYGKYCITIQGKEKDLVRASEKFMMKYYGIIS